jgi:hypothetical protein
MWRRPGLMVTLIAGALAVSGVGGAKAWRLLDAGSSPAVSAPLPVRSAVVAPRPSQSAVRTAGPARAIAPAPPAWAAVPPRASAVPSGAVDATTGAPTGRAEARVSAGPVQAGVSVRPGRAGAAIRFGPWRCGDDYEWDVGHPVLARPCHSLGGAIRVMGRVEAAPGVQTDVSLSVRDARTGEVVAGPYHCAGLMFTDFELRHECGPVDLQAPHGGRYVVVESWAYTGRSLLPGGDARGPEFTW